MRNVFAPIALAFVLLAGCDQPEHAEPTPIVEVEQLRSGTIVGCCECMTADFVTYWPECHSHMCDDQCVTGERTSDCEWIDSELVCPLFECP